MKPKKPTHKEIKEAIDTYYFVFKTKDALAKAADFVGVSVPTMKRWYYGSSDPPRWHYKKLQKIIQKAELRKTNG